MTAAELRSDAAIRGHHAARWSRLRSSSIRCWSCDGSADLIGRKSCCSRSPTASHIDRLVLRSICSLLSVARLFMMSSGCVHFKCATPDQVVGAGIVSVSYRLNEARELGLQLIERASKAPAGPGLLGSDRVGQIRSSG